MVNVQAAAAPAAALSLGVSNTAAFNYSSPVVAYVNVTFSSWPLAFSLPRLDSLMSNPSQNSGTFTVSWLLQHEQGFHAAGGLMLLLRPPKPFVHGGT